MGDFCTVKRQISQLADLYHRKVVANSTALKLSYDSDPFVVISYGKKVFRTRVIRHSLNPVWDEKMLFHVRRNEQNFTVQFSVLDWDNVCRHSTFQLAQPELPHQE
jgi:Ca2+-dependent lipid-binding protein